MKLTSLLFVLLLPILLMAQSKYEVKEEFLKSFADAFNAHNLNFIMAHMTDDCVFKASTGADLKGGKNHWPRTS